uniref:Uncharacterized protein n=1 Tax=Ditylum brightwellii TaxID=49249 RepID=A0A7S4TA62_9STRA
MACWRLNYGCLFKLVTSLIDVYPEGANVKNKSGYTPLHIACLNDLPVGVLKQLLDKCPNSARSKDFVGDTPLSMACWKKISLDRITLLLNAYPGALRQVNDEGDTPLHVACSFEATLDLVSLLLKRWPGAAREVNAKEETPLHIVCNLAPTYCELLEVLSLLLDVYPEAARVRSSNGFTPLRTAYSKDAPLSAVLRLLEKFPGAVRHEHFTGNAPVGIESFKVWKVINDVHHLFSSDFDIENATYILDYFIHLKWWGGTVIVFDINPSIIRTLGVNDKVIPNLLFMVGSHCRILTLWKFLGDRQDLVN